MTDVRLPDGSIGRFPDDMSDEDITDVLSKQFSSKDVLEAANQASVDRAVAGAEERGAKPTYRQMVERGFAAEATGDPLSPFTPGSNRGTAMAAMAAPMIMAAPTTLAGAGRLAAGLGAGEVADQGLRMAGAPPWLRMVGGMVVGGAVGGGGKLLKFGRAAANPLGYTDEAAMQYLKPGAKTIGGIVAQGAEKAAPGVVQSVPMAAQKAAGAIPAASTASVPVSGAAMAPTVENIVAQGAGKAAPSVSGEALAFAEKLQGTVAALKGQGLSPGQIASAVREANPGLGETVARKMVDDILAVQSTLPKTTAPLLSSGSRSMATVGGGKAQPYFGPARVPTDDSDLLALLQSSLTGGR